MPNEKEMMRHDWDERARRDAFLYIASWRNDWDEKSFFESGEEDVKRLVDPLLQSLNISTTQLAMAELGCGAGRMTRSFAQRFHTVYAVDISIEMQTRAKEYLRDKSNIHWILSDGETLSKISDASVDFVFSYLVLQHMPNADVIHGSIRELMRILKPGGAFLFQYNGSQRPTMNWKGRAVSRVLDSMAAAGLKRAAEFGARRAGMDPAMVGKTWRGAALPSSAVAAMVRESGASLATFRDETTPLAWCYGRKS